MESDEALNVAPPNGDTLDRIFMFQSPSISSQSASNLREHSASNTTQRRHHSVSATVSSAAAKEEDAVRDWHRGLEINWRTTPLGPRDDAALLRKQQSRCASCGSELKRNLLSHGASRYHYCRFTGLIHCVECHRKERAVIPHRVLHDLDCRPSYVCCAAKEYLDRMHSIPCLSLSDFAQSQKVQSHPKVAALKKVVFELEEIKK